MIFEPNQTVIWTPGGKQYTIVKRGPNQTWFITSDELKAKENARVLFGHEIEAHAEELTSVEPIVDAKSLILPAVPTEFVYTPPAGHGKS